MNIEVKKCDITTLNVDAIVNAANSTLLGGGGVDGAIHQAGGPEILSACRKIGYCSTGQSVITTAGQLKARYVIHTVGPIWHGGKQNEKKLLGQCYTNSLKLAAEYNCASIAFPNISTGIYGYPKSEAAQVAIESVHQFIKKTNSKIHIIFAVFDNTNFQLYQQLC